MEVICTQQPPSVAYVKGRQITVTENCKVYVGSKYEVERTRKCYKNTTLYILAGKPRNWGYNSIYFSVVSDLDETELIKEREEVYG